MKTIPYKIDKKSLILNPLTKIRIRRHNPQNKVLIIGQTGSGKSCLAKSLIYDLDKKLGVEVFDGSFITEYNLENKDILRIISLLEHEDSRIIIICQDYREISELIKLENFDSVIVGKIPQSSLINENIGKLPSITSATQFQYDSDKREFFEYTKLDREFVLTTKLMVYQK